MTKVEALRLWSKKIAEGVMPAYNSFQGACMYRDGDKQCAVGVLIPLDVLGKEKSVNLSLGVRDIYPLLIERGFDLSQVIEGATLADLHDVQRAHDSVASKETGDDFRILFFSRLRSLQFFKDVPADVWDDVMGVN